MIGTNHGEPDRLPQVCNLPAPPANACRCPGWAPAADARAYLRRDLGGWPAIIVDTYSNRRTLPQHLIMVEFYRLARSRLLDGGSLYVNFLAWPEDALFRTRAECTLRSVFAGCSAWPVAIEHGRGWVPSWSSIWRVRWTCAKAWIRGCTGSLAAAKAGGRILDGRAWDQMLAVRGHRGL